MHEIKEIPACAGMTASRALSIDSMIGYIKIDATSLKCKDFVKAEYQEMEL
jgi:hypothetical protein